VGVLAWYGMDGQRESECDARRADTAMAGRRLFICAIDRFQREWIIDRDDWL